MWNYKGFFYTEDSTKQTLSTRGSNAVVSLSDRAAYSTRATEPGSSPSAGALIKNRQIGGFLIE
jgi:hypothetical protein